MKHESNLPPAAVRLTFCGPAHCADDVPELPWRRWDDPAHPRPLAVEAADLATGAVVAALALRDMAFWLEAKGYAYATGSNGVWVRNLVTP